MLLALMLLFAFDDELPEGWVKIKATNLGYLVTMPKPERKAFQDKGPDDKPVHISYYRGNVGKVSYLVTVSEFSKTYITQPAKVIFDNSRDGSLARSGGTLVSDKDVKLGTVDGREIVTKIKEAGYVKARVYVYNLRQYSVMIAAPKEEDLDNKESKLFFDSFKLTPIKKTTK